MFKRNDEEELELAKQAAANVVSFTFKFVCTIVKRRAALLIHQAAADRAFCDTFRTETFHPTQLGESGVEVALRLEEERALGFTKASEFAPGYVRC